MSLQALESGELKDYYYRILNYSIIKSMISMLLLYGKNPHQIGQSCDDSRGIVLSRLSWAWGFYCQLPVSPTVLPVFTPGR